MAIKKLVEVWDGTNLIENNISFLKKTTNEVHLPLSNNIKMMHSSSVVHRNITLDNILLDKKYNPVLLDIGNCKTIKKPSTIIRINPLYIAPEMLDQEDFCSYKADIWALGICFYVMITGQFPIVGNMRLDGFNENPKKILERMLAIDPKKRIYAIELCELLAEIE